MKKIYFILVFSLVTFIAQAQIVNIPDADFKSFLLYAGIDTNNDNEIQVSEALAVTSLSIPWNPTQNIQSLTGLGAFSNLTSLQLSDMHGLTTIDLSNLTALQTVSFYMTPIASLDVSMLTNLQNLSIGRSSLTTLNVSGLSNLTVLNLNDNDVLNTLTLSGLSSLQSVSTAYCTQLATFNIASLPQLKILNCNYSLALTSIDVTGLSALEDLNVSYCHTLTSLNLAGLSNLKTVNCEYCRSLNSLVTTGANAINWLNCNHCKLTAINVTGMSALQFLDCANNNDYSGFPGLAALDLTGLTNLTELRCNANNITNLNVNHLLNLTKLECGENLLTSLNVTALTNLTRLGCPLNQLTALNVTPLIHLQVLGCNQNQLSTLDVSTLVDLNYLYCYQNNLSVLDLTNLTNLAYLECQNNQLTALDLTHQAYLTNLDCSNNLIPSLDLSSINNINAIQRFQANQFKFSFNPNLTYVNMKYGPLDPYLISFNGEFCPNLRLICADEENIPRVQEILAYSEMTNVQVNSYCTYTPGGIYNTISGTQTFDANSNGCDALDSHFPNTKIAINDTTTITGSTFTDANGNYSFFTQAGNYVLTPILENPYFTVSPTSATVNFASVNSSTQTQNFCITPLGIHYDVEITLIPTGNARPGFDAGYRIVYKNKGNQILSGSIDLNFDDAILDLVSANPNISNQSLNHLNWSYSALYPFESREIFAVFNLNSPQEIPAVNIGDNLHYVATISTNGQDETPADTVFEFDQTVTGSFDPNDKTCLEGNTITPEMVGGYLHYLIRFQNSGTAAAENIVVKDIIDTTKFDISSLQLTSTSHPQVTKITGNKVEFQFANINLPAEIDNEPGSHGYVAFKIKTKGNLIIGNSVANKADIYFDYNFPIETNTATSTVALLGINQVENKSVSIAPNPTKNKITITSKGNITSVQLFDVQGRILETMTASAEQLDFDLSQKTTGVYFVKIITEKGTKTEKIIKQ
ncbi:T9SS type A sorting domain-containing protein [Flavobacterium sp.]|uniref:DUF7619 domain-containing protein n=1 Tax=Flavobacterium sp. TaxID=239 RepID=UPI00261FF978|nr:T9SS type A sorting domain-containing protein [Flavobacterium sp.]